MLWIQNDKEVSIRQRFHNILSVEDIPHINTLDFPNTIKRLQKYIEKEELCMNTNVYSSWETLPLILQAKDVQMILGISKGKTYEIMNSVGFPTIHLNKRMVVSKDKFYEWLNKDERKIRRRAIYVSE